MLRDVERDTLAVLGAFCICYHLLSAYGRYRLFLPQTCHNGRSSPGIQVAIKRLDVSACKDFNLASACRTFERHASRNSASRPPQFTVP